MSADKRETSRAESARQRRAERATRELQQTTQRAIKPIQTVTRRVSSMPAPKPTFVETKKKQRRFNVALGLPEIHLRKQIGGNNNKPSPDRGWRITSLAIVIAMGFAIYFALYLPLFNIPSVTVLGNNRLTREEISNALGVLGQSIFTVQPAEVETNLRINYPELLTVKVDVYLPNHVYVTVTEREPVILWQQNGAYTWIDAEGVAFRPHGVVEGLVPVTGLATPPLGVALENNPLTAPPYMQKELASAILILAPNVPADTTMIYSALHGLGWVDVRGWQAFFGSSAADMPLKIRIYQSLVASITERRLSPIFISVVHADAPYYRMAAEVQYQPVSADNE